MESSGSPIQSTKKDEKALKGPQQGTGIRCPNCGGLTKVIRSMPYGEQSIHGRIRKCDDCDTRVYSEEKVLYEVDHKERKK